MSTRPVDLRSDTVTRPTPGMYEAMLAAELGDDVFEDDPTIVKLEARSAELVGHEAGLFMASGTQANQTAIMSHTRRGDEVILGRPCHIQEHEVGATAVVSGVSLAPLDAPTGVITGELVRGAIRSPDVHHPETGLLCLEYAHSSGAVQPLDDLRGAMEAAREAGIPVHLDGARIFNAAIALDMSAAQLAQGADSIMFCLSKGLGAPIGSLLCGSATFIAQARRCRKILGGGMRQVGLLGAAGLYALEHNVQRLGEDHDRAARLAEGLGAVRGLSICEEMRDINMVWFAVDRPDPDALVDELLGRGVKILGPLGALWRMVTHLDLDDEGLDFALKNIVEVFNGA